MIQTREVSMTRAETADEHMESTPRSHRCNQTKCPCSCHLLNLNEKWKMERGAERRNNRSYSDLKTQFDLQNDIHGVCGFHQEMPNFNQRNEHGRDMPCVNKQESNDGLHEVYGACGGAPGGPPSDDSSSDDNSDDGRKNKDYRSAHNKGNNKKTWIIDAAAWQSCIEVGDNFEDQAARLLEQRKLPNQDVLNAACAKYTLSSLVLINICQNICNYLKEKSETIVNVWAAKRYRKNSMAFRNEIIFVVLTSRTEIVNVKDFSTYQRCVLEVKTKKENKEINEIELQADNRPSPEEIQDLEKCLRENAKLLMERHSKLTRVTAGWFRVNVNETGQYSVKKELCIVLYVHVKGFLPLNEKPFPKRLGKYPVEVREGIFTLCRGPNDYHRNVKMGCGISGERQGTLGAFVEFENDGNLYGITCAHVVFGNETLKRILEHGHVHITSNVIVYQPVSDPFGNAVAVLHKRGGNGIPGMEIALIRIHQHRLPNDGTFPDDSECADAGFGPGRPFVFCSGKVCESENHLQSPIVYKYGSESKLTIGVCRVNGASVRTHVFKDNILDSELVLHGQIEIQSVEACPFAKRGDSGALIFTNGQIPGELSALAIFEGQMEGTNVFTATPICAVLDELRQFTNKQCKLKTFPPYHSNYEDHRLGAVLSEVSLLAANVNDLREKFERIDRGLAQDLAAQKREIKNELQKQSEDQKKQTQILQQLLRQNPS